MKKVYPDVSKNYVSVIDALTDNGFKFIGEGYMPSGKEIMIFRKNGTFYRFHSMDHFNSTIYQINLINLTSYLKKYTIDLVNEETGSLEYI